MLIGSMQIGSMLNGSMLNGSMLTGSMLSGCTKNVLSRVHTYSSQWRAQHVEHADGQHADWQHAVQMHQDFAELGPRCASHKANPYTLS